MHNGCDTYPPEHFQVKKIDRQRIPLVLPFTTNKLPDH